MNASVYEDQVVDCTGLTDVNLLLQWDHITPAVYREGLGLPYLGALLPGNSQSLLVSWMSLLQTVPGRGVGWQLIGLPCPCLVLYCKYPSVIEKLCHYL